MRITPDEIYQQVNVLQQSWENQDPWLKENGEYAASYNEHLAHGIYSALPPDQSARIAELENFIRDYVADALDDLECYIGNNKWTRHQQAELDDCRLTISRLKELLDEN